MHSYRPLREAHADPDELRQVFVLGVSSPPILLAVPASGLEARHERYLVLAIAAAKTIIGLTFRCSLAVSRSFAEPIPALLEGLTFSPAAEPLPL